MRWGGLEHEESALAGPRFSMHFGRVSPYLCILGGEANAWRWNNPRHTGQPEPRLDEALGPQWSTVGGLDIYLERHFVIRMGELSIFQDILKRLDNDASYCQCGDCLSTTLAKLYRPVTER